jgi:hypothetical protein
MKKHWILGVALAAISTAGLWAAEPVSDEKLMVMAKEAETATEHAAVAKQFRLRAEALEKKAKEHEAQAKNLASSPMAVKWPGMMPKALQREKQAAIEARRAAQESYQIADRHLRLAVERDLAAE